MELTIPFIYRHDEAKADDHLLKSRESKEHHLFNHDVEE